MEKSLFKIEQEYLELVSDIEEVGGEVSEEIEQRLAIHKEEAGTKLLAYKSVISMVDSNLYEAEKEIERIKAFIEKKEKLKERLKGAILQALLLFGNEDKNGVKSLEYGTVRFSTKKSPKSVSIDKEESIPEKYLKISLSGLNADEYKKIITKYPHLKEGAKKAIKKNEIKTYLSADEKNEIEGASLAEGKIGLTIK